MSVYIIALASLGQGLSGGDRIYIELVRRWSAQFPVTIFVWEEGLAMCQRQKLAGQKLKIQLIKVGDLAKLGFVFTYFYRVWLGIKLGLTFQPKEKDIIYSASEFWMDALPAVILKLRFPKVKWVAAWYQTAPTPWQGFSEGSRGQTHNFKALLYWLAQLPIKPLVHRMADYVLVNNESERKQFPKLDQKKRAIVLIGAIDLKRIQEYQKANKITSKKYLAVFQGRFHPQKGVVELVEIWQRVCQTLPKARLAMIGDGPLMNQVKARIKELGLESNIKLFGYVYDGPQKYQIFSQSEVVVHPAFYDSGGMAAAEAMAFDLPCVGFDLQSYKSYYPQGMITVPINDLDAFSAAILNFRNDKKLYDRTRHQAKQLVEKSWSWEMRADQIWQRISN